MLMSSALPLHPVMVHFPIAGAFFAAAALALAVLRPRAREASLNAAVLLLSAAVAGGLVALATGWFWADQLAYLAGGWGPFPGPKAVEGLAQEHALLAVAFVAAACAALVLSLLARRREKAPVLALLAAALSCGLVMAAGHVGGTMVHAPPAPKEEPVAAAAR